MTIRRAILVFLSVCVLFVAASVQAAQRFGGTYSINGINPGVGAYKGTLTITPRGDIYDVSWRIAGLRYTGVGIVVNDTLSVAYSDANHSFVGVAAYTKEGGVLDGHWAVSGGSAVGSETATRK